MRVVLLGDSHLARVRRDLPKLGDHVENLAVGGSTVADLFPQLNTAECRPDDAVVVSIGSNDAGWRGIPLDRFTADLTTFLDALPTTRLVYLAPADAPADQHANVASRLFGDTGATVVDGRVVLHDLGPAAFEADDLHLTAAAYRVVLPAIRRALETYEAPPPGG